MYEFILFDLDGTLTDSAEGITKCVQYALQNAGIEVKDRKELLPFIGPPLSYSFPTFYKLNEEQTKQAIKDYRSRFEKKGWKENMPYEGIVQVLESCRKNGAIMAVASSKPQVYVEKILKYFDMQKYFQVVVGAELDGRRSEKLEVVQEAMGQLYDRYGKGRSEEENRLLTVMVGDRKFDIEGAHEMKVEAIGVSYGFPEPGELAKAGADAIAGNVEELGELLTGGVPLKTHGKKKSKGASDKIKESQPPKAMLLRMLYLLAPLITYYVIDVLAAIGLNRVLERYRLRGVTAEELALRPTYQLLVIAVTAFIALCIYLLYRRTEPMPLKPKPGTHGVLYAITLGILFSLGCNILVSFIYQCMMSGYTVIPEEGTEAYEKYEQVAKFFQSASLQGGSATWIGLLLFGFISPLLEELIFRWVLLNRVQRVFPKWLAILVTALFFGIFHGNLLQGGYAFFMGVLMAGLCVYSGSILIPLLFHVTANSIIYGTAFLPENIAGALMGLPTGIICLILGVLELLWILRNGVIIHSFRGSLAETEVRSH